MLKQIKNFLKRYHHIFSFLKFIANISEGCPLVYRCRDYTNSSIIRRVIKIAVTPYCLMKYFFPPNVPGRKGLALVIIAKDEGSYIKEWLDFHIKQGVAFFIVFDNDSTDNFHDAVRPYVEAGIVDYRFIRGKPRQTDAYNMAIHDYGRKFKYMGFIDTDEFLYMRKNMGDTSLYDFVDGLMTAHKNAGALAVNWCIFGTSGHEKRPAGGVLENFTMCAEHDFYHNHEYKSICDPLKILAAGVHAPLCFYRGFGEIDENGEPFDVIGFPYKINFEKIRINHYFCKSKQEFEEKIRRGKPTNPGGHKWGIFEHMDQNAVRDTEILSRM